MNSRRKGKRLELDACRALRALGFTCQRTQQYQGSGSYGDVEIAGTTLHAEVKGRRAINMLRWMEQADRDRRPGTKPIVLMRENAGPWHLLLRLEDLPRVIEEYMEGRRFTDERAKATA